LFRLLHKELSRWIADLLAGGGPAGGGNVAREKDISAAERCKERLNSCSAEARWGEEREREKRERERQRPTY